MTLTTLSPTSGEPGNAQPVSTLLGKGSEFEGQLSCEGAEVNAEVTVGAIVIQGIVRGNITAKRSVEIHSPGRVKGNINTPSLFIEKGVFFDGHCQMDSSAGATDSPPSPRHSGGKKSASGSTPASGARTVPAAPSPDSDPTGMHR